MTDTWPIGVGSGGAAALPPASGARTRGQFVRRTASQGWRALDSLFGGPARTKVILLFAAVLALNSADTATVGASATELRTALQISNIDVGLLVAVTAVVVAIFSLPFGVLVDRANRILILSVTVVLWGFVMLASASVGDFTQLLLARLALGAMTAASGPGVASLVGDYFPGSERGKIYGYVLAGELLGAGAGFVISGDVADISWRAAFVILALPTFPLAWALHRLPEPLRGGGSQLEPGATVFRDRRVAPDGSMPSSETRRAPARGGGSTHAGTGGNGSLPPVEGDRVSWVRATASAPSAEEPLGAGAAREEPRAESDETARPTDAQEVARRRGIKPDPRLVLREDPRRMNIFRTMQYVLAVRTNRILILSSACGYFFLTGIETFGLEFVSGRGGYNLAKVVANLLMLVIGGGAVLGVLLGGRLGDNLVRRGHLNGRILVAAVAALVTTVLFIPALVTSSAFTALPYLALAAFALTAQNPPIDAARLDVMPPLLWGRAEGIRSFLRTAAQALAPLAFGGLSDLIGGTLGLRLTFGIMLVPFLASGIILFVGMRSYPTDVATAAASAQYSSPPRQTTG